jgi:hypothetical protein
MQDVESDIKREEEAQLDESELWALPIIQYACERKKISDATPKVCSECGETKLGSDFYPFQGKCKKCSYKYQLKWSHEHPKHLPPMDRPFCNNKDCAGYLGVHVAETVLSTIFEGITRCKTSNPGYDFTCKKGYKIDVKASCIRVNRGWKFWQFYIRKNKVADYFLCLAFDSRESLNPEHLWLIPGDAINNFQTIDISKCTLGKWSQYELPLTKVHDACFAFREGART